MTTRELREDVSKELPCIQDSAMQHRQIHTVDLVARHDKSLPE